jgi:peptidoglycan hydrolase CwlO-like protein
MSNILDNIHQIINIGYEILFKLEAEEVDLDHVSSLYDKRAQKVNKLTAHTDKQIADLTEKDKQEAKKLFTRLEILEKELQKELVDLSDARFETIRKLGLHKKANSLYKSASQNQSTESQIVDITSGN